MNMNNGNRKIQVAEFPKIPNTIKKYDNFESIKKINKKKNKKAVSIKTVALTFCYLTILVSCTLLKMNYVYSSWNLEIQKKGLENKLVETQREIENLEKTVAFNYDLKQVENKSKNMGFVRNGNFEYLTLNKSK